MATVERASGSLVVKLSRTRVAELVEQGVGRPFAPAGKVFREWVAVPVDADDAVWSGLLDEAIEFVGSTGS